MIIKILGSGCPNCQRLEVNTRLAVSELGLNATVEKITDFEKIVQYGALSMPALVIDEQLKIAGRIPNVEEIKDLLQYV
ncbi:MAG: TM0996/MTH895 family glutaredoxin-like protein [Candidatus Buchananbacteria bacterium]|nr:TM0996/MTH895 family glutaredoxin-like protein [Candidatus Buchananbacteria bacterium]